MGTLHDNFIAGLRRLSMQDGSMGGGHLGARHGVLRAETGRNVAAQPVEECNRAQDIQGACLLYVDRQSDSLTTRSDDDDSWEDSWDSNIHQLKPLAAVRDPAPTSKDPPNKTSGGKSIRGMQPPDSGAVQKKGRGTFRFGGSSLYSDRLSHGDRDERIRGRGGGSKSPPEARQHTRDEADGEVDLAELRGEGTDADEEEKVASPEELQEFVDSLPYFGAHILEVHGFPSSFRTADVENLIFPLLRLPSDPGDSESERKDREAKMVIRWLADARALAVFDSPETASMVLASRIPTSAGFNLRPPSPASMKKRSARDLYPPIPRPATSIRVAQRMIAGALSDDSAMQQAIRAKGREGSRKDLMAEKGRKQRIQTRQQLREEAWGDEDE